MFDAINLFVAVALLTSSATLVVAGRRRPEGLLLAAFLALVGVNFLGKAVDTPEGDLVALVALVLDPFLLVLYVTTFPYRRRSAAVTAARVASGALAALGLVLVLPLGGELLLHPPLGRTVPLEHGVAVIHLALAYAAAWILALTAERDAPTEGLRRRATWLTVAVGVVVVPRLALLPADFGVRMSDVEAELPGPLAALMGYGGDVLVQGALLVAGLGLGALALGWRALARSRGFPWVAGGVALLFALGIVTEVFFIGRRLLWGWPVAFGLRWVAFAGILAYGMLEREIVEFRRASDRVIPLLGGMLGGVAAGLWAAVVAGGQPGLEGIVAPLGVGVALAASVPAGVLAAWAIGVRDGRQREQGDPERRLELYRAAVEAAWAGGGGAGLDDDARRRLEGDRRAFGVTHEAARALEHVVRSEVDRSPPLAPGDEPVPGLVLDGVLGEGGQARVFEARHLPTGRRVVVKAFHLDGGLARRRLLQEMRALRALHHPHVVRLLDVHVVGGRHLLVTERVEGETLARLLEREGRVDEARARLLAADVLSALAAAHSVGVVHRDVKPSNVLVGEDGRARLSDFGIASSSATPPRRRTAAGFLDVPRAEGTPGYMPPEQAAGADAGPAADVYAAAVLLVECLTGVPPEAWRPGAFPDGVPAAWAPALARALRADAGERFRDAGEMLAALAQVLGEERVAPGTDDVTPGTRGGSVPR